MTKLLIIIVSIVTILIILLYIIKVTIFLEYKINGMKDNFKITFSIFGGLIKYKPYPNKNKKIKKGGEKVDKPGKEGIIDKFNNIFSVIKSAGQLQLYLKNKLTLKELFIKLDFGTGDAFFTGIFTGLIWALLGSVISYLFNTYEECENKVNINPNFSEKVFNGHFYCIFSIKSVYIIVVMTKMQFSKLFKKNTTKGGDISA